MNYCYYALFEHTKKPAKIFSAVELEPGDVVAAFNYSGFVRAYVIAYRDTSLFGSVSNDPTIPAATYMVTLYKQG